MFRPFATAEEAHHYLLDLRLGEGTIKEYTSMATRFEKWAKPWLREHPDDVMGVEIFSYFMQVEVGQDKCSNAMAKFRAAILHFQRTRQKIPGSKGRKVGGIAGVALCSDRLQATCQEVGSAEAEKGSDDRGPT